MGEWALEEGTVKSVAEAGYLGCDASFTGRPAVGVSAPLKPTLICITRLSLGPLNSYT